MANLWCYARYNIERKYRRRIRDLKLKNMRIMHLVHEHRQLMVWVRLLKSFKENTWKVRDNVREFIFEVLELVGNCDFTN